MQTEPTLYNVWLLTAGLRALRFTAPISALIYETQEECNEVKKNKGRGRENKQALHCDTEYAAVIELDLKKFTKTLWSTAGVHNQPFYHLWCQPFMAVTMIQLFHRADPRSMMHLVSAVMAVPTMLPHATTLERGTRQAQESLLFCLGWEHGSETSGENLPGSGGYMVRGGSAD